MLQLSHITKSFPGGFKSVLKNFNLELKAQDFCILIGSNGSGKSTLLRTIAGEEKFDSGSITINDEDLTHKDRTHLIATVTQEIDKGTVDQMTLLENLVLSNMRGKIANLALYKQHQAKVISQIKKLDIGLEHYIDKPLASLSDGQKQIIATLMATSCEPQILLLDEHTSALDPKMQTLLMDYTANTIVAKKITSIMITHKLDDAIKYGNRLIMLHQGKIVLDVRGEKKQTLTIDSLLALFHQYGDSILTSKTQGASYAS